MGGIGKCASRPQQGVSMERTEAGTIAIVSEERCTGCGACNNSCPVEAIAMSYDAEGFLYPEIDESACIKCGKCVDACPETDTMKIEAMRHAQGQGYAVMASDEIRQESSSGGMFSLLANHALEQGGIVFGAAYAPDFRTVHHVGVESKDDLDLLRSSKYVQSDIERSYSQVKEALAQGRKVLFTGCPCQIGGLYSFLHGDDDNLVTAEVICHAANSVYAYQSFIDELANGRRITNVDFRKKKHYGWITNVNIYFSDGSKYIEHPDKKKATWYKGFLGGIITRKCCPTCHYAQLERVADITMGDFWRVTEINKAWHDKKGTSLIFVNSEKGADAFKALAEEMKLCKSVDLSREFLAKANPQLVKPSRRHRNRDEFFGKLQSEGYRKALASALEENLESCPLQTLPPALQMQAAANPPHYDVGITGYWWSTNYGSVATYYALYKLIEQLGYSVVLLDRPEKDKHGDGLDCFSRKFIEKRLSTSRSPKWENVAMLNELCDTFVIGSDQVWNKGAIDGYGYFFFLDFTGLEKKRIAYAASFGERFNGTDEQRENARFYLRRFDGLSVREYQAVETCEDIANRQATWVLDPVFLLERSQWDALADDSRQTAESVIGPDNKGYLLAYILNPSDEKREMLLKASELLDMPLIVILNGRAHTFDANNAAMSLPNTLKDITQEDWFRFFKNASYVITDSHHGSAFAIVFRKQFICCSNKSWGQARYTSLFGLLGLASRQSLTLEDMLERGLLTSPIDYDAVDAIIDEHRTRSLSWLSNALEAEPENRLSMLEEMVRDVGSREARSEADKEAAPNQSTAREQTAQASAKEIQQLKQQLSQSKRVSLGLEKQLKRNKGKLDQVKRSPSYRIGKVVTWLPRKARSRFKKK